MSSGGVHGLALKDNGAVVGWSYNTLELTDIPAGAQSGVVAVAAGGFHSLALKNDGTVVAWGFGEEGQTAVPAGLDDVKAVAAGENSSLALKNDGTVVGWGGANVPANARSGVTAIAAGGSHNLAIRDTTPPDTTLDSSGPTGTVNTTSAAFEFSSTKPNSTFECKLDGGEFAACQTGQTYENFPDGPHVFEVRAKDASGNTDATPASRTWTVDTIPPDTTAPTVMTTTPAGKKVAPTANVTAAFSEAVNEASVEAVGVFKLVRKGTTAPLAATVGYDAATKKLTLNPRANLKRGTTYTATISTGAEDEAGNALAQPKSWMFTIKR